LWKPLPLNFLVVVCMCCCCERGSCVISELVMGGGWGIYGRMGGAPAMARGVRSYVPAGLVGREQSWATEREPRVGMHGQARSHGHRDRWCLTRWPHLHDCMARLCHIQKKKCLMIFLLTKKVMLFIVPFFGTQVLCHSNFV
jgi:hypothetical protein